MRNLSLFLVGVSFAVVSLGCKGDPNKPEYWEKAISGAKSKKDKLRRVDDLRSLKTLDKSFVPMIHKRLAEEKAADVKGRLAQILGELKDPSSVDPLTDAIDWSAAEGDSKGMNKEIAVALGNIADPKAAPTLLKMLNLKDNYTAIAAIEGLGEMKAKEAVEPLVKFARDENTEPFLSKKAIQALGNIGDPGATDALVDMMFKERRGVSFYVESSYSLYQIGESVGPKLLPVLEGTDKERFAWAEKNKILAPALTAKAAQVLGDLHEPKAEKGLLQALKFNSEMLDIKLFVRIRAADALGRLRSQAGAKALADMVDETEGTAREEYVRALVRIGGREAIANLVKTGSKGPWDARQESMEGVAMLGDERELPVFNKWLEDEEKLFTAECKEDDEVKGCKDLPKGIQEHKDKIAKWRKILEAAKDCKDDATCWAKKLSDGHEGVRARAAYEVGRSKNPALVGDLMKHLTEENLETRLAIIQGIDWLVHDSKEAAKAAQDQISGLDQQIADEKGKTQFQKVNEDLRRLAVKIRRS